MVQSVVRGQGDVGGKGQGPESIVWVRDILQLLVVLLWLLLLVSLLLVLVLLPTADAHSVCGA